MAGCVHAVVKGFAVYLEQISDQISFFSPRMAWEKKRITVAAVYSAELIQSSHLSDKGRNHTQHAS